MLIKQGSPQKVLYTNFYNSTCKHAQQEVDCCQRMQKKLFSKIQLPITTKLQLFNVQHNVLFHCYVLSRMQLHCSDETVHHNLTKR